MPPFKRDFFLKKRVANCALVVWLALPIPAPGIVRDPPRPPPFSPDPAFHPKESCPTKESRCTLDEMSLSDEIIRKPVLPLFTSSPPGLFDRILTEVIRRRWRRVTSAVDRVRSPKVPLSSSSIRQDYDFQLFREPAALSNEILHGP